MSATALYVAMGVVLAFGLGSLFVYRAPSRPCYRCGERVEITARRCRHCGYRFTSYRLSR